MLAPVLCAGCSEPDVSVCRVCEASLAPVPRLVDRDGLCCWTACDYRGPVAAVLRAFKDEGRTDVAASLARTLRVVLATAVASTPGSYEVCTIPSTPAAYRARGYRPVPYLLHRCGVRPTPVLQFVRERADQVGLTAAQRRKNLEGSLASRCSLVGRRFVLVDDITTTGSTLHDARRALCAAGAIEPLIVVIAQTPRRYCTDKPPFPEQSVT